jgi:hypothetical protein
MSPITEFLHARRTAALATVVLGLAVGVTGPTALAGAQAPTGKAAMSSPTNCKKIKNKKKRKRCQRHQQGQQGQG